MGGGDDEYARFQFESFEAGGESSVKEDVRALGFDKGQ